MGIFSIYTGLIYNECFSVALDLFGTNWEFVGNSTTAVPKSLTGTYPFGVDPVSSRNFFVER
jgi:V-type H+-transporting ATPase subunit a